MDIEGLSVFITRPAYNRLMMYGKLCPKEVSGFGKVENLANGFLIREVFCIEQIVTSASTDIDPQCLMDAVMKEAQAGRDSSDWNCWWHSHATMHTFFSGTDIHTIGLLRNTHPLISIVINHKRELKARIDWSAQELKMQISILDIPLRISDEFDTTLKDEVMKELVEKVKVIAEPTIIVNGVARVPWANRKYMGEGSER